MKFFSTGLYLMHLSKHVSMLQSIISLLSFLKLQGSLNALLGLLR